MYLIESLKSTKIDTDNILSTSFDLDQDRKVGKNISDSTSREIPTFSMHQKESSKWTKIDMDNIFSTSFDLDQDRKVGKNISNSTYIQFSSFI